MIDPFSYTLTPKGYECSACKGKSCKLWRQYQTFASNVELLCAVCAGIDQNVSVATLDAAGTRVCDIFGDGPIHDLNGNVIPNAPRTRTDHIGNLIPAVPTENGETFWGYTSVPSEGILWWRSLPNL